MNNNSNTNKNIPEKNKNVHRQNCECACILCTDEGLYSTGVRCVFVQVGYGLGEKLFLCLVVLVLSDLLRPDILSYPSNVPTSANCICAHQYCILFLTLNNNI